MPKIMVVLMEQQYPFEHSNNISHSHEASVIVRQSIAITPSNKTQILAKATFLKNLKSKYIVKLQSILQQEKFFHLQYEFIQSQKQWLKNTSLLAFLHQQLTALTNYLTNIGVKASIRKQRIGLTQQNNVKYFMGLDFEWDNHDDEDYLVDFYRNQLEGIFGREQSYAYNSGPSTQLVPYGSWPETEVSRQETHDRKVSFASIPSRYNRLAKIDQQLSQMKSINKDGSRPNHIKSIIRSQSNEQNLVKRMQPSQNMMSFTKKFEDRKYSGDLKFTIFGNKKLCEKESDIKSQRGFRLATNNKLQEKYQNSQYEIETIKSKSRIQEMKYQEYLQITKSNKNYLQDFISVLENDDPETTASNFQYQMKEVNYQNHHKDSYNSFYQEAQHYQKSQQPVKSSSNQICVWKDTSELQRKAREAIQNSRLAIKRIKTTTSDANQLAIKQ